MNRQRSNFKIKPAPTFGDVARNTLAMRSWCMGWFTSTRFNQLNRLNIFLLVFST